MGEIGIDQAGGGAARGARRALGHRGEDAIHSLALQLAENLQADRIARIVQLGAHRRGDESDGDQADREQTLGQDGLGSII